ncbi:DUF1353 domain-containing protein [Aquitalea aquatica]|uniref:DUF1353 domain-containing protein n=1 Tax=Aquitalea aquatica TaxID=3044273 RepID=A0A838Y8G9_9NEIS|nr:DUF1353 domain-containing protein [Aquitalea magnusonii]MBA4707315.1 DUF1353 domain-containing protein [Aquitalea magnusonii]
MSAFLSELATVLVDDTAAGGRGIWRVVQPFVYQSDILGKTITVEPGFLTDYASVPRVPVLYLLFGDTTHKAAVLHDWLYHHHEVCDEATANLVLLEAAKIARIPRWRRLGIYLGVKLGGSSSWEEDGRGNGHQLVDGVIV